MLQSVSRMGPVFPGAGPQGADLYALSPGNPLCLFHRHGPLYRPRRSGKRLPGRCHPAGRQGPGTPDDRGSGCDGCGSGCLQSPTKSTISGKKHLPNILTSLEYERILSASGPTLGDLVRPSDKRAPGQNRLDSMYRLPGPAAGLQFILLQRLLHVCFKGGHRNQGNASGIPSKPRSFTWICGPTAKTMNSTASGPLTNSASVSSAAGPTVSSLRKTATIS